MMAASRKRNAGKSALNVLLLMYEPISALTVFYDLELEDLCLYPPEHHNFARVESKWQLQAFHLLRIYSVRYQPGSAFRVLAR